jgi:peptidoglycan/LPS O-acetylase OafA/YrhL
LVRNNFLIRQHFLLLSTAVGATLCISRKRELTLETGYGPIPELLRLIFGGSSVKYNPALDGLRAVAILLVLLHHYFLKDAYPQIPGGWIGVDVFFVLSGYLITSILLREYRKTGHIELGAFYLRRALRLAPALLLVCSAVLAASLFSPHGANIRQSALVAVAYIQNWAVPLNLEAPGATMDHTWSLATEEQFYLLWPLLLPLVVGRRPLVWLTVAVVAMTGVKFALWRESGPTWFLTYGLPTRPVGLLIGCALAFLPLRDWRAPYAAQAVLIVALCVLAATVEIGNVWAPLAASLLTAALIACLQGQSFLSASPLRYIGRISYGLYIYHWPILLAGNGHAPKVVLVGLGLIVAVLSYEFVEKPFLRLKDRPVRIVFAPAEGVA